VRLRLRYGKLGKVRFTSHRDTARLLERALRKAALPVAYSGGFAPRPKLSFGLALPTGAESVAEYLDVDLDAPDDGAPDVDIDRLSAGLPAGMDVLAAAIVDPRAPSLQEDVVSCTWRIEVRDLVPDDAGLLVHRAMTADALVVTRERKGKEVVDDLRPALLHLSVAGPTADGSELHAELAVHPRSVRPAELLTALALSLAGGGLEPGRVHRTHQWIERDGARREPLPLVATGAPHAEARAS
jgi:radical SAM-linked protein